MCSVILWSTRFSDPLYIPFDGTFDESRLEHIDTISESMKDIGCWKVLSFTPPLAIETSRGQFALNFAVRQILSLVISSMHNWSNMTEI